MPSIGAMPIASTSACGGTSRSCAIGFSPNDTHSRSVAPVTSQPPTLPVPEPLPEPLPDPLPLPEPLPGPSPVATGPPAKPQPAINTTRHARRMPHPPTPRRAWRSNLLTGTRPDCHVVKRDLRIVIAPFAQAAAIAHGQPVPPVG